MHLIFFLYSLSIDSALAIFRFMLTNVLRVTVSREMLINALMALSWEI